MEGIIANFISSLFRIIELAIILECILSWVIVDRNNGIMGILTSFTEPILRPFRFIQSKLLGNVPIDVSPIFAIIVLGLLKPIIISFVLGIL
ncbi:YggT family protein [Clostridium sardiniense]|uniref:YggT family protein n=1 Tax=Clostridium sardiniense TaxID=29369 RepID=A0ABS7KVL9_CLOSR|nr:YggT family protein [Clostridium sardiniense]MBM7835867.1 YggT family protein [Clostridium sardiniense]MBY0754858.1 YggT family protein [Clostridium sardiniense]MDQ0461683.1 YggT family protein [Clostridium sardiniense]